MWRFLKTTSPTWEPIEELLRGDEGLSCFGKTAGKTAENVVVFCMLKRCHPVGLLKQCCVMIRLGGFVGHFLVSGNLFWLEKCFSCRSFAFFVGGMYGSGRAYCWPLFFWGGRAEWKWIEYTFLRSE